MELPSPSSAFPSVLGSPPSNSTASSRRLLSGSMNWEPMRQRLLGSNSKEAFAAATELREGVEIFHTVEFPLMLSALLPAFSSILAHKTQPNADSSALEQRLRHTVLEIISRMPRNEILRPHAPHLVAVALDVLNRDFEENAVLASRILFDLFKVYRSLPEDHVQPYLRFVHKSYESLPASVQHNFLFASLATTSQASNKPEVSSSFDFSSLEEKDIKADEASPTSMKISSPQAASKSADPMSTPQNDSTKKQNSPSVGRLQSSPVPRLSPGAYSSFRVLTECPLVVMLMFQLYPKFLKDNIKGLISVMMEALALRAPSIQTISQGNRSLDSSAKRLFFSRCRELVAAQAKTLSFLTYLLRGYSIELKPYEDRLASNVVALMSTCPRDVISTRKELLVATRHLLNSEFRNGFFRHVDTLLDERVLIGSHHTFSDQTLLRPLGYTTLSDLVHHVRPLLTMSQISRVVSIFSRVLHDSTTTIPFSTQYSAVRTLISLVDVVFHNKDRNAQAGRDILVRILRTLGEKLAAMQHEQLELSGEDQQKVSTETTDASTFPDLTELLDSEHQVRNGQSESMRDFKSIIRAIIHGHKTLIWYINNYPAQREKEKVETIPPRAASNEEVASAMTKITHTERSLIDRYIVLAFPCIRLFKGPDSDPSARHAVSDQYREALTFFAAAFTTLDGYQLRRTLGRRLDLLVEAIAEDSTVVVVPRHLLVSNATTSYEFCCILLEYLMDNMDALMTCKQANVRFLPQRTSCADNEKERIQELASSARKSDEKSVEDQQKYASAHLQLFERVLKSFTSYRDNEKALRPRLRSLVSICLRCAMEKPDFRSDNYCMLLRFVFRSISAGKFEESYRELLPMIPFVLNGLYRVYEGSTDKNLCHTILELLLTIPARLSSLLPHMNLLLRVIVHALDSGSGDLANLGLRTAEFWIDNLQPDFLFPELSMQKGLFVQLMKSLSRHLKPAPYPYGLLTLRLLGKLGGKNRLVLRESMDIQDPSSFCLASKTISKRFEWETESDSPHSMDVDTPTDPLKISGASFLLALPVDRCVKTLQQCLQDLPWVLQRKPDEVHQVKNFISEKYVEEVNLESHCYQRISDTYIDHVVAARAVLKGALSTFLRLEDDEEGTYPDTSPYDKIIEEVDSSETTPNFCMQSLCSDQIGLDGSFERTCLGILLSDSVILGTPDISLLGNGLYANMYLIVRTHSHCFVRVDANGARFETTEEPSGKSADEETAASLKPFGYFEQSAELHNCANPLAVNRSVARLLAESSENAINTGLDLVRYIFSLHDSLSTEVTDISSTDMDKGSSVFFESLLASLCNECSHRTWDTRKGLYKAMCLFVEKVDLDWCRKFEFEIVSTALFALKTTPREMSFAAATAFKFVLDICCLLYGRPSVDKERTPVMLFDMFVDVASLPADDVKSKEEASEGMEKAEDSPCRTLNDDVLKLVLTELASTKEIVRVAARFLLKQYLLDSLPKSESISRVRSHMSLVKRVVFSRSLRLLPLAEQTGAVEALTVVVSQLGDLLPLDDQHLLSVLSEVLKMCSVADGEMTDASLVGSVDKNGFAVSAGKSNTMGSTKGPKADSLYSTMFRRRDCIISVTSGFDFIVPEELPAGVALRLAVISLLRAVIRANPDQFFDAETSTPVGNIRPHVISLLFRSLVSHPVQAVVAAHDALRDVLTLSVVTTESKDGSTSKSRLRKELLQTCIRPVLVNLKEYSRLSVHLLKGLSRLLSLLSSWFNKTLGEKLLDHLQQWTDPNRIRSYKIWAPGTEPDVAAEIINLFILLPNASHFVEPLVKTTIKLEACLPAYKSHHVSSPYRLPLARYLNTHCQDTIKFFLQRLKTPLYSELFQEVLQLKESTKLREYMSGLQCSRSLLSVCFDRPLGIIRSEKTGTQTSPAKSPSTKSTTLTAEMFVLHGIYPATSPASQKETALKQDMETKNKKAQILHQELLRTKGNLQAKASATGKGATPEVQAALELAKRKHRNAKGAYDRGVRDFKEAQQRYSDEVASAKAAQAAKNDGKSRPMTLEALELQHQGFRIVETLVKADKSYLGDHTDVLRAFRWLWRSKGRKLRVQYEEAVPPRYHTESKFLASFLVEFSRNSSEDVDLLFELIRIFLQPSTSDFSHVRFFLRKSVKNLSTAQCKQIIRRFFEMLAGESTEEIKTLSMQMVVFPMLCASFESKKNESNPDGNDTEGLPFLEEDTVKKFVEEVLFQKGGPIVCGDRLRVELLRTSYILLELVPSFFQSSGTNLLKFCWGLLKRDDAACKSWAYVVVSRCIATVPTKTKVTLQVFSDLLRSHLQESTNLVRGALNLLIQSLPSHDKSEETKTVAEYTNKVLAEEGSSAPQLAQALQIVVDHPTFFANEQVKFVRYMVNSLTRLGLHANCPPENRHLALRIVELVLRWDDDQRQSEPMTNDEGVEKTTSGKREAAYFESALVSAKKRIKTTTGESVARNVPEKEFLLDHNMIDTIANFLIRLRLLLGDPKADPGSPVIERRLMALLRKLLRKWPRCRIRSVYFEKVVNSCREENKGVEQSSPGVNARHPKAGKEGKTTSKGDDGKQISPKALSACLEVYTVMAEEAPEHRLLTQSHSQVEEILISCFRYAKQKEQDGILRENLKSFIVAFSVRLEGTLNNGVQQTINVHLEKILLQSEFEFRQHSASSNDRQSSPRRSANKLHDQVWETYVFYVLQIVCEITTKRPELFGAFSSALLAVLTAIVKSHVTNAAAKQKQGGVSYALHGGACSMRQTYHTPVAGVFTECKELQEAQLFNPIPKSSSGDKKVPWPELKEFDTTLHCAVLILRLLGNSGMAYSFTHRRKVFLRNISSILDSSNCVQLLMASVQIVGQWLLMASSRGPLTPKERRTLLWKMTCFDFNGLSNVSSQPLADLVSEYIARLLKNGAEISPESESVVELSHGVASTTLDESEHGILEKCLVACLMMANRKTRADMLSHFVSCAKPKLSEPPNVGEMLHSHLSQLVDSNYEGLGGRFWVAIFVDVLLSRTVTTKLSFDEQSSSEQLPPPRTRVPKLASPAPMDKYTEFRTVMKQQVHASGTNSLPGALRVLAQGDMKLCHDLFSRLLSVVWGTLPSPDHQMRLIPSVEKLLARPFNAQFLKESCHGGGKLTSNVVRSFLFAILEMDPLPTLDAFVLLSFAETYNCWYEVISLLERYSVVLSGAAKLTEDGDKLLQSAQRVLRHCYHKLGETSIYMSLSLDCCKLQETVRATSQDIYGKVDDALRSYSSLMNLVNAGSLTPTDVEVSLVEDRWLQLQQEQCQLAVISEYAIATNNIGLKLDAGWKQQDWESVRALCSSPSLVAAVEYGNPNVKLCETLIAVADGKLSEVVNLHAQTAQLCLYRWQLLPELAGASAAHGSLLQLFHRLVEIRESGQIMVETTNHSDGKTLPDLKNLLNAWRHRLPLDFEPLSSWNDIVTWRSHMFNAITSNFQWSEPSTLATLHDKPWTVIRMATTARKQGMRQTALLLLNQLTDNRAMDVSDAYLKLREQILAYNNPESETERTGGLNLINTTNLDFFDANQKSELFRLKAIFLSSLRRTTESPNQAYCHAVQICPTHSKAWISWGGLCSSLGSLTEKQGEGKEASKEARAGTAKKVAQYLAQAMGCYLEAVKIDTQEKTRVHLPKCLWLLTKDGSAPGVLCQTLENRGLQLPPWVWLPWIPQLLTGLCRVEGNTIKSILVRLVKAYPQAVYYSLRAFYLERRDVARAKGTSTGGPNMPSVAHSEELMSTLRRSHASLWSSLESILEELIVKFRPSYEEELLATISALLERAESHAEKQSLIDNDKLEDEEAMVASWSKTLSRIAAKFFRNGESSSGSNRRDERMKKTIEFKRKYKDEFEEDFKVETTEDKSTDGDAKQFRLSEYITRLQKWKKKLETQVARTPLALPLVESSASLAMFAGDMPDLWSGACDTRFLRSQNTAPTMDDDIRKTAWNAAQAVASAATREGVGGEYGGGSAAIEIPGQYCPNSSVAADLRPHPELHCKLLRFQPQVEVLRRNDQLVRRAGMVGSDGRTYKFLLQFAIPYWTRTDERTAQSHYIIDKFLRQNAMCARRHLSIQTSTAIPVAQRLRMTLDLPSRLSLDEAFSSYRKKDTTHGSLGKIASHFVEEVSKKLKETVNEDTPESDRARLEHECRLTAFKNICDQKVGKQVLLRHVQSAMRNTEDFYHFRRIFSSQLAANSLLQYVFSVAERTPQRFVMLLSNGQLLSPDFRVSYSNQGYIESHAIPYRMTPNIQALLGDAYIHGRFLRSFAMIAGSIREHREEFDPILRLLMRDDILAWYSKSMAKSDGKTQELERQLLDRVSKNVANLQYRFSECSPKGSGKEQPIDKRVNELFATASSHDKLCTASTSYHGWL